MNFGEHCLSNFNAHPNRQNNLPTMNASIDYQQACVWAVKLSAQTNNQSLTHLFLALLEQLPFVHSATAYEIYGDRSQKTGQAGSVGEQLIKRFPLDFAEQEQNKNSELLAEINENIRLRPSNLNAAGFYTRLVASIRDVSGPGRAVVLQGEFDELCLELLGNLLALYRNLMALHDSKERDLLTKLPNRQSFDIRILQVCEHFGRREQLDRHKEKSSWIAMLDIDHFKRINDTYGHMAGDEVLRIFAQLMEKTFRYNDFLFRFGGEEFVVILNLVNQDEAEATFERFRMAIANYNFPGVGQVTVSIGAAHINNDNQASTLLERADKALYHAKHNGRNQLAVYEKIMAAENCLFNPVNNAVI